MKITMTTMTLLGALYAGCASTIPEELIDARVAYRDAANGPASQVAPADLHKAHEALAKAEQAYADDPDGQNTRDLAYVATRKAQLADALGRQQLDDRNKTHAEQDYQAAQSDRIKRQQSELMNNKTQVAQLGQQLNEEQKARTEAEMKAADAERKNKDMMEQLSKLAAVKEEPRGTVITLSGSVLFAFNQATLLPEARVRLDQVATALLANPERPMTVEGYTDSRGSDSYNQDLSQRRAEAVRDYLLTRGIPADMIRAEGFGKGRPIADNNTAEGRANNRRVEIVVQPQAKTIP